MDMWGGMKPRLTYVWRTVGCVYKAFTGRAIDFTADGRLIIENDAGEIIEIDRRAIYEVW